MKIAIVGAGIMGLSIRRSLVAAGLDVTVFDQFPPMHRRGSSHGNSRIVRVAYADSFYAEIMRETIPLWRVWQGASTQPFLHEVGIVYFGSESNPDLVGVRDALASIGTPAITVTPTDFVLQPHELALLSEDGGWVHANHVRRFLAAPVVDQKIDEPTALLKHFDRVVLAQGAFARHPELKPRMQTVAYVEGIRYGPVWIDADGDMMYGFPSEPGRADFKIGIHNFGIECDPEQPDREADAESLDRIRDYAHRRFGIADPKITEAVSCLYTMTDDEDFRIDWASDRTLIVSPCSGHGFKFAPYIGDLVKRVLTGEASIPARFLLQDSP